MQRRDPDLLDRRAVLGGRVADVLVEAPARVLGGRLAHVAVAGDLGDHRGGGDRGAGAVALDHRAGAGPRSAAARSRRRGRSPPAGGPSRSSATESASMLVTCRPRRSIPAAERIDDADPARRPQHAREHLQPPLLGHLLGVVQAAERAAVGVRERLVVDQDRGGDQRARRGSRGRPRRCRRRSGSEGRGRRRTGGGCGPAGGGRCGT